MLDGHYEEVLAAAHRVAADWLTGLPEQRVGPQVTAPEMHERIDRPVPDEGSDPVEVIAELAASIEPGLVATGSGRYFGFVNGGTLPAALGADWLVSAWDQNTPFAAAYPGAAAFEQVAGRWVKELLGLPSFAAVGFVTGAQMANTTCLAAARHRVLAAHGHDVEDEGLVGAPPITIIVGAERHSTVDRSLRLLGLGSGRLVVVAADSSGRMDASALEQELSRRDGPTMVCAQAGNVNGGAFDPIADIADVVAARRNRSEADDVWLHVDGAFGLWVRASPGLAPLAAGVERADSWATDAHKWLNTPYDCGLAIVADQVALGQTMALRASYLPSRTAVVADPSDHSPEASRRARALVVWAALRSLGRSGVADLVARCCRHAAEFADHLGEMEGVEVLHQEINQLVVTFSDSRGATSDAHVARVLELLQTGGTCYATGTRWRGRSAMRVSVSNWSTDREDVLLSVEAIRAAHETARRD